MANITAKQVSELRAKTGCGMMDCKKALVEANGDFDEAIKILRERGLSVAAKKADRIAAEGIVDILVTEDGRTAVMAEINTESDFVAKNEQFREFVSDVLKTILETRPASVEELLESSFTGTDKKVQEVLTEQIFKIGEKISIRRFVVVEGVLSTYIHGKGTTGVIVKFDADEAAACNPGFPEVAKNVALQVAAMNCIYVNRAAVPDSVIEEEKEILRTQIANDPKSANKPAEIIDKMVNGRVNKYYETNCLEDQIDVKDDSVTVGKYLDNAGKEFGGSIKLNQFYRYEKGEGIEKRVDNLDEEVAKMLNK